ncbi:succinyl-diaminopimelate desuccinylase [Auraticoccus sp. F435]|uniref:Succinyl-diaminopimelate desuccinylase n=1 Tax=Auraticoccus cholistanensis TaxID=2656650 RepID=A0A6A9UTQ0_9ACTN|nr:succinyl-diaminopimelate desuccinylase [Auraticoccus cholistanensis]MVA76203.1 succinyl-diaminopimelate desuccinylase [Auraticoccus cholistanensis]
MALDLTAPLPDLLQALVDLESVSGDEARIADEVEQALRGCGHLRVDRDGDTVVARTELGRAERVVVAGHLDTVPVAGNLPSRRLLVDGVDAVWGRGSCDMKGGVAVALAVAARAVTPVHDVTWIFYDQEEVEAERNGLGRISRNHPEWLEGSFAVLGEPSNARVEGGCQGTLRTRIELSGTAAHSARAWMGHNAIHDAADVLQRLADHEPRQVVVDGLRYHEGLNAVAISGGIAGNVIPDRCVVDVNFRFAPDRSPEQAVEFVRDFFAPHALEVVDLSAGARPGLDQPAAAAFVAAVGGEPQAKFGWTDVARFSAVGVPAVNFGPGDPSKAHADDEFCPVADLETCAEALRRWLGV